ncbi:MAG: Holliday junction branch migration protein RuvA [Robiginitomaculum sp.]|nr:MAG: Holliday junction branch migration protein RuvA [Robiginitomaculum sp.]
MIGKLSGIVDALGTGEVILDVNGVGYLVQCGARSLRTLSLGEPAQLHIETVLRQDLLRLYGFASEEERAWFVRLQEIQGVGPKAALAVLDTLSPMELINAAALEDKASIARAQGVGPRIAARIAGELKDKPPPTGRSLGGLVPAVTPSATISAPNALSINAEAVSALVNLGLNPMDAQRAVANAGRTLGEGASLDNLIRVALKDMGT